jgi:hypothetical protein
MKFIIDKSEFRFEETFLTTLSQDNQSYILKNFNKSLSSSCEKVKVSIVKDELEFNSNKINYNDEAIHSEFIEKTEKTEITQDKEINENIEERTKFENENNIREPENIPYLEEEKIEDDFVIY